MWFNYAISAAGGKGAAEAAENRNYLTARMTEEIHEIIRVLQLTTYDEDEWDADNLTVMKKAHNAIQSKIRPARDWLLVSKCFFEFPLSLSRISPKIPKIQGVSK